MFHQEDVGILFPHLVKKPIVRDLKPGADGVTIKVPKLGQYHIQGGYNLDLKRGLGAVHILRKHILGSLNTLGGVVSAW